MPNTWAPFRPPPPYKSPNSMFPLFIPSLSRSRHRPVTSTMARSGGNGKLSKLKCMIKRWHSSSRMLARTASSGGPDLSAADAWRSASFNGDEVPSGYHPVYVGKSRRRYLVSSDLIGNPLFQNLLERSGEGGEGGCSSPAVIGCEVVLFEHLLWMLENADPKPESLDELLEFYAC